MGNVILIHKSNDDDHPADHTVNSEAEKVAAKKTTGMATGISQQRDWFQNTHHAGAGRRQAYQWL